MRGWTTTALLVCMCGMSAPPEPATQPGATVHNGGAQSSGAPNMYASSPVLKVGDKAPGFTLKTLDGKKRVALADYRNDRPVLLFFGSYT